MLPLLTNADLLRLMINPALRAAHPFLSLTTIEYTPGCCGRPPQPVTKPDFTGMRAALVALPESDRCRLLTQAGFPDGARIVFTLNGKVEDHHLQLKSG